MTLEQRLHVQERIIVALGRLPRTDQVRILSGCFAGVIGNVLVLGSPASKLATDTLIDLTQYVLSELEPPEDD